MFKQQESQEEFYKITWSGYESVVLAPDPARAAAAALREGLQTLQKDLDLSFSLKVETIGAGANKTEFYSTSSILMDIGEKKLAKDLDNVQKFFSSRKTAADLAKGKKGADGTGDIGV